MFTHYNFNLCILIYFPCIQVDQPSDRPASWTQSESRAWVTPSHRRLLRHPRYGQRAKKPRGNARSGSLILYSISVYQYWNSYEEGVDFYQLYGGRYLITRGLYPVIGATPACLCLRLKIPPQRLKISSQSLKITPQKY